MDRKRWHSSIQTSQRRSETEMSNSRFLRKLSFYSDLVELLSDGLELLLLTQKLIFKSVHLKKEEQVLTALFCQLKDFYLLL